MSSRSTYRNAHRRKEQAPVPASLTSTSPELLRCPGTSAGASLVAEGRQQRPAAAAKRAKYEQTTDAMVLSDEDSEEKEKPFMDSNEAHCRACGEDTNSNKLLCCEGCPAVYHISCLEPPLPCIPRGDWLCPSCGDVYRLQDVERFLDVRQQQQQPGQQPTMAGGTGGRPDTKQQQGAQQQGQRQFYVKWRSQSYLHCAWVAESQLQAACKLFQPLKQKLQKFEASRAAEEAVHAEEVESGELVHGVNPLWLQVDRVLAQRPGANNAGVEYLVKWKDLDYDKASWEMAEDLAEFQAEINRFLALQPIAADARERAHRAAAAQASGSAATLAPGNANKRLKTQPTVPDGAPAVAATASGKEALQQQQQQQQQQGEQRGQGSRKFEGTPAFLKGGSLHPYQLEGLNWLHHSHRMGENVILADEMGLGKTVQTIAFLAARHEDFGELPHLVVVPLSTMRNWEREFALWAPHLNVVPLLGNQESRANILQHELYMPLRDGKKERLQERVKFHVLLTSYEMVQRELTQLSKLQFDVLAVDEGHRLRNKDSRLFQDLNRLAFKHRLLLTGTPLQNNICELFMLLHFVDSAKFRSQEDFATTFSDLSHEQQVEELHAMLAPHLLRRLKKDVLKSLPPKLEQIVRVELSAEQRELYRTLLTKNYKVLLAGKREGSVQLKNLMMELRKCCNHPYLFSNGGPPEPIHDHQAELQARVSASGKLELLDKMMVQLLAAGHRVLIFSQFTRTLDILEDWLLGRRWSYLRIDGEVPGSERQKRVDLFNKQPDKYCAFLLSTRACGLGLNLATADTVIIYDSDWNPHNDLQAQARAHRMGQTRPVMTYRLVTRATIEERMMQKAKNKMVLERLVVGGGANTKLEQATLDDILRYGAQELFADEPIAVANDATAPATDAAASVAAGTSAATAAAGSSAAGGATNTNGNAAAAGGVDAAVQGPTTQHSQQQDGESGTSSAAAGAAVGAEAAATAVPQQSAAEPAAVNEREERAARLRIVWDDAAMGRLLDRSALLMQKAKGEAEEEEGGEEGFMNAFKVATFDMVEEDQEDSEAAEAAGAPAAAADAAAAAAAETAPPVSDFWGTLLRGRFDSNQEAELAQMGRGRRARVDVRYEELAEVAADDSNDSDYEDGNGEDCDSDDDEVVAEARRESRRLEAQAGPATHVGSNQQRIAALPEALQWETTAAAQQLADKASAVRGRQVVQTQQVLQQAPRMQHQSHQVVQTQVDLQRGQQQQGLRTSEQHRTEQARQGQQAEASAQQSAWQHQQMQAQALLAQLLAAAAAEPLRQQNRQLQQQVRQLQDLVRQLAQQPRLLQVQLQERRQQVQQLQQQVRLLQGEVRQVRGWLAVALEDED